MAAAVRPQASLDRKKKRESAGPAKLKEEGDRPRGTALLEEGLPRSRPKLPEPLVQALALWAALGSISMVAKKHAGQQGPEEPSLELGLRACSPALHDRLERPLEDATKWATVLHRHELVGGDALAKRCDQVDPVQQLPGRASLGGLEGE